ncbi:MAG: hypothetical protein HUU21_00570 [Polyangiaceae bacterium]|nr:hypothetical protein [Polyangiaceae bacterium]
MIAVLFGGAAALLFGGCVFVVAASQCATTTTPQVQTDHDVAIREAAEREQRSHDELVAREAEAQQKIRIAPAAKRFSVMSGKTLRARTAGDEPSCRG